MMSRFMRRMLKLGPFMGNLAVSATGCFALTRGFRLLAIEEKGSDAAGSVRAAGTPRKQLAGIGAALFLLAFVANEAAATIVALRR
jgi:hypothetical protein